MTADAIARVTADLTAGRVANLMAPDRRVFGEARQTWQAAGPPVVIDATGIYRSLAAQDKPVYIYEDHPCISPPWPWAAVAYTNEHGNVIVMSADAEQPPPAGRRPRWDTAQPVDWDRVRWLVKVLVWLGGTGGDGPVATCGPAHGWLLAVYGDGQPADITWVHLRPQVPMDHWDMAQLVLLGALNFLNCTNVEIAEPARSRAQARRIAATGIRVHELTVRPPGPLRRAGKKTPPQGVMPLTSVRGHFAHYGPAYNRGLLFGRLAGRFWIPQHAAGNRAAGTDSHTYRLQP